MFTMRHNYRKVRKSSLTIICLFLPCSVCEVFTNVQLDVHSFIHRCTELDYLGQEQILDFAYLESNVVCRIATDWFDVGLFLDIPDYELETIRRPSNPTSSKCTEMLKKWWTSRTR